MLMQTLCSYYFLPVLAKHVGANVWPNTYNQLWLGNICERDTDHYTLFLFRCCDTSLELNINSIDNITVLECL